MSKMALRVIPYGGFDIPGLEGWLARLAGKGLRYGTTLGPLACFERAEPARVQVHLEPIQGPVAEDPELNALYEAAGWDYWGLFRNEFFVYATADLTAAAHTDPEALDWALRRFFRQKLVGGLLLIFFNFLLLGLYQNGAIWGIDLTWLHHYPLDALDIWPILPWTLSLIGMGLLDLAYLLGLVHLARYRRRVGSGRRVTGRRGIGWLTMAGTLVLLPVVINCIQLIAGQDYRPYDLEGSSFVTLTELEGEDFRLSGNLMYNMNYISHGGTLLDPESWYFQQYASFGQNQSPSDVPHLEVRAVRYPLEVLAQLRVEELSRVLTNNSNDWVDLGPVEGADQAFFARREAWTHTSEITGETRYFLPGGELILRRGDTVLYADYYGEQDLPDHLDAFVRTLNSL